MRHLFVWSDRPHAQSASGFVSDRERLQRDRESVCCTRVSYMLCAIQRWEECQKDVQNRVGAFLARWMTATADFSDDAQVSGDVGVVYVLVAVTRVCVCVCW